VSEEGLISASEDHFDHWILDSLANGPRTVRQVVFHAMGRSMFPYLQVGEGVLAARVLTLVEEGRFVLEGSTILEGGSKDIWSRRVWLRK
jgi:hypothetical protein